MDASRFGYALIVVLCRLLRDKDGKIDPQRVEFLTYTYTEVSEGSKKFSWRFPTKTDREGSALNELATNIVHGHVVHGRSTDFQFTPLTDQDGRVVRVEQPTLTLVRRGDQGGLHYQYVFLAGAPEVIRLRDRDKDFASDESNAVKTLSAPEWREAIELWGLMKNNGQASHRVALAASVMALAQINSDLATTYGRWLESEIRPGGGSSNGISFRKAIEMIQKLNHDCVTDFGKYSELIQLF